MKYVALLALAICVGLTANAVAPEDYFPRANPLEFVFPSGQRQDFSSNWSSSTITATASHENSVYVSSENTAFVAFKSPAGSNDYTLKVAKTTDGGRTWSFKDLGSAPERDNHALESVSIHGSTAYGNNTVFAAYYYEESVYNPQSNSFRVARSLDNGETWSVKTIEFCNAGSYNSLHVPQPGVAFASYSSSCEGPSLVKVARTTDNGESWEVFTVSNEVQGWYTSVYAASSEKVFVSFYDAENGNLRLAKSNDSGETWEVTTIADSPTNAPGISSSIQASRNGKILVSFIELGEGDQGFEASAKMAVSDDDGKTWRVKTIEDGIGWYTSLYVEGENVFLAYYGGSKYYGAWKVARSTDSGETWTHELVDKGVPAIHGFNGRVYAASFTGEVLKAAKNSNDLQCGNGSCGQGESCSNCVSDCGCTTGEYCSQGSCNKSCGNRFCDVVLGENSTNCAFDCKCGDLVCHPLEESLANCFEDCGLQVCGDGFCQRNVASGWAENEFSCPEDCTTASCGDNICQALEENKLNCFQDCPPGVCGDGKCNTDAYESEYSCTRDCAYNGGVCGDGICDYTKENDLTCSDCPQEICGDGICQVLRDEDEWCGYDCDVIVCGDGFCNREKEAVYNCPSDCIDPNCTEEQWWCAKAYCGDSYCSLRKGENAVNCTQDCTPPVCGDNVCDVLRENNSCWQDCTWVQPGKGVMGVYIPATPYPDLTGLAPTGLVSLAGSVERTRNTLTMFVLSVLSIIAGLQLSTLSLLKKLTGKR